MNRYFLDWTFNIDPQTASALLARICGAMTLAFALTAMLAPRAQAQTYSVLYSFTNLGDGSYPYGGVIADSAGNLYGTTYQGGRVKDCGLFAGCGVVYKLDPSGKLTVLHSFVGNSDGRQPYFGNLFRDSSGNLFSTTVYGGIKNNIGVGTAFEITSAGRETVLHQFLGGAEDAQQPNQGLILDADGYFYGTSVAGGSAEDGTVYRMSKSGRVKILHTFTGTDGIEPTGWLVEDKAGNFYGTAGTGGTTGGGTVFKITKSGKFTLLYTFKGAPDGGSPEGGLAIDNMGNLYGGTFEGGDVTPCPPFGCGVIFKVNSKTGAESIVHTFVGKDGAVATGGPILDSSGNLYGTTWAGGVYDQGTVFKIDTTGALTTLYNFTGQSDGGLPFSGVTADQAGNLYGATNVGGINDCESGCGVVFKLTP
jgi:uncharacterized repeat protein (TIGR03803 family)